ncbi:hypothetical protein M9458_052746, partial [Cirrhinus mrigala]
MNLASVNAIPGNGNTILEDFTIFIFQNGRDLEDYVEESVGPCHHASCDDVCLMKGFRCGLDDDLRFVMPRGDPCWTLLSYINFALWTNGSTFTVGEAEEDRKLIQPHLADVSHHDPEPSQPLPQLAEPEPEPTADGKPELRATEPSPLGVTAREIATKPEPIESDQVPVGREGVEDSTSHCTAEGERCLEMGQLEIELDLIDFTEDIYVELLACPEQFACLDFPPTLPLLSPPIGPAASVSPPLPPSVRLHRRHGWRIPHLHLQPLSPGLHLGPSTQRLSAPSSPPWPLGPPAPLGSSLPPALPQSSVAPAPLQTSGSPPRLPEPWALPWPSGSSVSPWIIGSPSPPRAPPPLVGPLESSALPPPWLLPPSAPPWATIMAAAWVSSGSSCSGSLRSPPWLLPPSTSSWTLFVVLLSGVCPPPEPPPTLTLLLPSLVHSFFVFL